MDDVALRNQSWSFWIPKQVELTYDSARLLKQHDQVVHENLRKLWPVWANLRLDNWKRQVVIIIFRVRLEYELECVSHRHRFPELSSSSGTHYTSRQEVQLGSNSRWDELVNGSRGTLIEGILEEQIHRFPNRQANRNVLRVWPTRSLSCSKIRSASLLRSG